jgi:outer membrane receptor protein involved in Fe transport
LKLLCLLLLTGALQAQIWQGKVLENGGAGPVAGAQFSDLSGTLLLQTAENGSFSFLSPPATVRVTAEGFESKLVSAGARRIILIRVDFESSEYTITAQKYSQPGSSAIQGDQIRKIAGAGGDALRTIRTLPGVIPAGDYDGRLSVQGGGPEDNEYFIDGVPWPAPYHFGGFVTTINSDLLDSVYLYTAGFPVRWGNADGAILGVETRKGKDQFSGNIDMSLLIASFLLEGPLASGASPKGSWTFSGRRSYFDLILPHIIDLGQPVLPYFWDLSATMRYEFDPHNRLRLIALSSDDEYAYTSSAGYPLSEHFQYGTIGLNWEFEGENFKSRSVLYGYETSDDQVDSPPSFQNIDEYVWGLKEEDEFTLAKTQTLSFGGDLEHNYGVFAFNGDVEDLNLGGTNDISYDPRNESGTASMGTSYIYLQDQWQSLPTLSFTGGLRYDHAEAETLGTKSMDSLDPRLSAEWDALKGTIFRFAWGLYAQDPTPTELSAAAGNPNLSQTQGQHQVFGVEQDFGDYFQTRLELYHKTWSNLIVDVPPPDPRIYSNDGVGQAEGADLYLRYDDKRQYFGWLSVAYSKSERKDSASSDWYLYEFDEPWVISLVGSDQITTRLDFGMSLTYHSGALYTPQYPYYDAATHTPYTLGAPFSARLEDYLRIDAKLEYAWPFELWKLTAYLEVLNLTNSPNPVGINYPANTPITQIPLLPYCGLTASF